MPQEKPKRLSRKELIKRNKRIAKKRQTRATVVALVITAFLVYVTGIYGASLAYFGDFISTGLVYLQFGGGFPAEIQLSTVKQTKKMGSSLCVLDSESLHFISPTAKAGFTYYHSMQNPLMATSDNRVAIYNANETSLKIANAHKVLFSNEMQNDIIHVSMSKNNKVAVTTKSQSFNSEVTVFDYQMNELFTWYNAKSFPVQSFLSQQGRTLAISTVLAIDGNIASDIYVIDAMKGEEKFSLRSTQSLPLAIEFIKEDKILVLYDNQAQIISVEDGSVLNTYSYNGEKLLGYDVQNAQIALALGEYSRKTQNQLVLLNLSLEQVFSSQVDQTVTDVIISSQRVYLLGGETVQEYTLTGQSLGTAQALTNTKMLIDYYGPTLISQDKIEKLAVTEIK